MLGTLIGDIVGSVRPAPVPPGARRARLFHPRARFTGHTVCTVAVADALLSGQEPARALQAWVRRHGDRDLRSPLFGQWLTSADPRPIGSHDNGAAARVAPAGLLGHSIEDTLGRALRVTAVTHDHPEGIRSALAVAATVRWALDGLPAPALRAALTAHFAYDCEPTLDTRRAATRTPRRLANDVPLAITCALSADGFEQALRHAVAVAPDDPSVAAIAGGIAEARFGIPPDIAVSGLTYLPPDIAEVLRRLYHAAGRPAPWPAA